MICSSTAFAAKEGWTSDYAAAKKEAAETGKDLLIDFTGSDWCGWCIKLDKEVFQHDEFKTGVKDKFILVELDYPRDKSIISEETQAQNTELAKRYAIKGYPTILLTDASGAPYAATGYKEGGPVTYVAQLDELRNAKETRDKGLEEASKAEGVAKAEALVSVLKSMNLSDELVANFYPNVTEEIFAADPKDTTGFKKNYDEKQRFANFESKINDFAAAKDMDGALEYASKSLGETWPGENAQKIALTKFQIQMMKGQRDEALKTLDDAKAYAPESPVVANIDKMKASIEAMKAKAGTATPRQGVPAKPVEGTKDKE
ncbi:thioredoxin family protein [Luteolibacter pohnpeiensis]|uniref:Thioredoxin family protein n=1 Tax=Luteolibacter pohnpeiensis TaxID=454153 RepID=A0A934S2U3_9BACT|nr:thioredoxin family protein [Luteolibacter pohnpeiensis]MBK1880858.1 thioredoxin family protein [Luteolibacter pohnpeiensis]